MELWRWMRSLLPPHPTWWSPKGSAKDLQTRHLVPSSNIGRPSQHCRHSLNSRSKGWSPNADEGATFNQSPACGMALERAKALSSMSGAESRRRSKEASSLILDRARWWRGTSISWREDHSGLAAETARVNFGFYDNCPFVLTLGCMITVCTKFLVPFAPCTPSTPCKDVVREGLVYISHRRFGPRTTPNFRGYKVCRVH